MDTKKEYIAPELTVVSFKTERGYAASDSFKILGILSSFLTLGTGSMEAFTFDETDQTFTNDINWE